MGKNSGRKWYAVACGRSPGIYESWAACQDQVKGFRGAVFKSFTSKQEAQDFCGQRGGRSKHSSVSVPANRFKQPALKCTSSTLPATAHRALSGIHAYSDRADSDAAPQHDDGSVVVYFDGGSRGNPGPAGCGAAVFAKDGDSSPIATDHAFIGHATNNQAEYEGLILGLRLALRQGASSVTIRGDSMLVVNQVNRTWKANHASMKQLLDVVLKDVLPRFSLWRIEHVYRNENGEADRLANEAMDRRLPGPLPSQQQ